MRELHQIEYDMINTLIANYLLTFTELTESTHGGLLFRFIMEEADIQSKIFSMDKVEWLEYREIVNDHPDKRKDYSFWAEADLDRNPPDVWNIDECCPEITIHIENPDNINRDELLFYIENFVANLKDSIMGITRYIY